MRHLPLITALIGVASAQGASAGQFEVWAGHEKGRSVTVLVTFQGDGVTEDAQLDLGFDESLEFVSAKTIVDGSVCVLMKNKRAIRIVPPTGGGTPLPVKPVEYCSFLFRANLSKGDASAAFRHEFIECASPTGMHACEYRVLDVSESR
ncbi:MAG: hypothetical protein KatS3mg125_2120 [Lysobacterales bacterium]|jgi:hypothetical protein|nr:MAG: hypothetical protein KatS3mg125_2120 [Xanthomonadales bacterium]